MGGVLRPRDVQVRLFDRKDLGWRHVVDDFLATWKLGPPECFAQVADQNRSIEPVAQEFLRQVNPDLEPIGGLPIEEVRGPLGARLALLFPGRGARPARAEVEAFYGQYRESNERVRQRYFPDRATSSTRTSPPIPRWRTAGRASLADFAAIAARLHVAATAEIRRLEAEIAIREGRLALDPRGAGGRRGALRRALRWCPDHGDAHRTLAKYLLRLDRLGEAIMVADRAAELSPDSYEYRHFLGILLRRAGDFPAAAEAQRARWS